MPHRSIQAILFVALVARVAAAEPGETADAAAARGRTALKAGRIHEACDAFAASDALAPRAETELSLADCYAQDGKPASAARAYHAAADKDTNAARRKTALAKAERLEARAPKLHFSVQPAQPGAVIRVDGVEVAAGEDAMVDTGPHEVTASAPGFEGHASAPVDREGTTIDVVVRLVPTVEAPAAPAAPAAPPAAVVREPTPAALAAAPVPARDAAPSHRKRNGIIVGAAGLGFIAGAVIAYEAGSSKLDDAARLCPGDTCANNADLARGHSLISDGRTLRGVSIGVGITGAVLIAAGGYLMMTDHAEQSHVAVDVRPNGGGVTYTARW